MVTRGRPGRRLGDCVAGGPAAAKVATGAAGGLPFGHRLNSDLLHRPSCVPHQRNMARSSLAIVSGCLRDSEVHPVEKNGSNIPCPSDNLTSAMYGPVPSIGAGWALMTWLPVIG